jgi:tRNA pseudouridine32 synthase/23S rRNA pseudouridine746 synthase
MEDYSRPLKLLAKSLAFIDPLSGVERRFESRFGL